MLDTFLDGLALSLPLVLAVPTAVYASECIAACLLPRSTTPTAGKRPAVAVLVPAHNEETEICPTLASIHRQLRTGDRLVVIADNCTDRTAALARQVGADVIERHDDMLRGKGYALDAGLRYLASAPPPVVIMVDADCQLGDHAIDALAQTASTTGRPVQSRYLLKAPAGASLGRAVAEFAFLIKNRVRPLGLSRLGLACQLTGSGMAFPWSILNRVQLANAHLVEDMKLGLDLAQTGAAPCFCDDAHVISQFPTSEKGTRTQRQRWETGHLGMTRLALVSFPGSLRRGNADYAFMLLDVIVPPLTLLGFLLALATLVTALFALAGGSIWPLIMAMADMILLLGATAFAWIAFGRRALPARALLGVPSYVLRKMALYPQVMFGRARDGWIRTDRTKNSSL